MKQIGHVDGFPIELDEVPGSVTIGSGAVLLENGVTVSYPLAQSLTGLAPDTYRLYFMDAELQDHLTNRPGFSSFATRRPHQIQIKVDKDLTEKRGAYSGGLVVISNGLKIPNNKGEKAKATTDETLALLTLAFVREVNKPLYRNGDRPNINEMAKLLAGHATALKLDRDFSESSVRARLTTALDALKKRTG